MIEYDIKTNELIKYLALIDNISSANAGMKSKTQPRFLFRGESKNYNKVILPKYLRPLEGTGVRAKSYYLENELSIIGQFRDEAYPYINNVQADDYKTWREYAQHYGVPTKLLDWSSNPLVALFFSCLDDSEDGFVWMLNWQNYHAATNKNDIHGKSLAESGLTVFDTVKMASEGETLLTNPVIYRPTYTDLRMSAQSSYFMLWGDKKEDLILQIGNETVKEAKAFETTLPDGGEAQFNDKTILYYFVIDKTKKKGILTRLSRMGINNMTLFPGLEGVGRHIDAINHYTEQEYIDCFLGSY